MNKTIDINSSDEERTNILKNKTLKIVEWDKSKEMQLYNANESIARALKRYIKELNIRDKYICFNEFESDVKFTQATLKESISQMTKKHANLTHLGKLLSVIDEVCENAIKIDVEKYRHNFSTRIDVRQVVHLLSGFYDEDNIYPVKITIYERKVKENQFYLIITVGEIKTSQILKEANTITDMHSIKEEGPSGGIASINLNISSFIKKFNTHEGIIIKNLPDGLLNQHQIEIKKKIKVHDAAIEKNFANKLFSKVL
ncbi:MAG: hypothetical protein E7279_01585 [Lachnospiraceae bacterium]|nr:hypothetical protein [Lachnospiraceae bacterium]